MDFLHDPYVRKETDTQQVQQITQLIKKIEEKEDLDYSIPKKVLSDLTSFFENKGIKGIEAKYYGSYLSGLALRTSNINISLESDGGRNHILRELYKHLLNDLNEYDVSFEESTGSSKSKIILTEPINGIVCEIVRAGKRTSQNFARLLRALCNYDRRVRPLIIAIRVWAEMCEIHEVENGRLHPLCYILMVIHFLQQCQPPVLPIINSKEKGLPNLKVKNGHSIGELWLELLKYYSQYDWTENWISITKMDVNKKKYDQSVNQQHYDRPGGNELISIEDPFIPDRNLAKSVTNEEVRNFIQSCFKQSYEYFSHSPSEVSSDGSDSEIYDKNNPECEKINYSFSMFNFTKESEFVAACTMCEDIGTTCKGCKKEPVLQVINPALPKMSHWFLRIIKKTLEEVYKKHELSECRVKGRKAFVADMEKHVRERFRGAKLELMGSSVNGFGFLDSDLDICMTFEGKSEQNINVRRLLRDLCTHLRKKNYTAFALYTAKIPIVKFSQEDPKFSGDISLYNVLAVHNSKLLYAYSLIDERVRILGCAMKLLAKHADIADSANKTLSSYSYILLVIHFLQQTDPPVLPCLQELYDESVGMPEEIVNGCNVWFFNDNRNLETSWAKKEMDRKVNNRKENYREKNKEDVGKLWLNLLKYYVEKLDQEKYVISIRQKKLLDQNEHQLKRVSRLLNIEDPFILTKNLGCVVSEKTAVTTREIFIRARNLFGIPRFELPVGFQDWIDFFFNSGNLTGKFSPSSVSESTQPAQDKMNRFQQTESKTSNNGFQVHHKGNHKAFSNQNYNEKKC